MITAAEIQRMLAPLLPGLLGIELAELTPEKAVASLLVRPDLCTAGGVCHGGTLMAFADTVGAVGTVASLPAGARTTTIESKTNFFRAVRQGRVSAVSTPLHVGRTTIVVQTDIRDANGKAVALVTQTQIVLA